MSKPNGTFLLRFSDSEIGGITIAWVAENPNKAGIKVGSYIYLQCSSSLSCISLGAKDVLSPSIIAYGQCKHVFKKHKPGVQHLAHGHFDTTTG